MSGVDDVTLKTEKSDTEDSRALVKIDVPDVEPGVVVAATIFVVMSVQALVLSEYPIPSWDTAMVVSTATPVDDAAAELKSLLEFM